MNNNDTNTRRTRGTAVSVIGIGANLLLFAAKFLAGTLLGSISVRADAMNNLSDAASSLISLFSFRLSAKPADREHPFGHARIEYVASMIVSFLILFVGVDLIRGSVEKLIAPVATAFSLLAVIILSVSIAAKLGLALLNHRVGKQIDSEVMRATAADNLSDAAATSAVLIATLLSRVIPAQIAIYIDPVMGVLVSILIFVAGARVLNDTKNSILGTAPDKETVDTVRRVVGEYPDALGIHDLVVHTYGAGHTIATLHVEVDGKQDIFTSHDTIDLIEKRLRCEYGIECTIHLDPITVGDPLTDEWHRRVAAYAQQIHPDIRIHDFRMVPGTTHTNLIFDMEVPFEVSESDAALKVRISELIAAEAPCYFTVITVDRV